MTPTDEQKNIIDASGHIVVVARPGSGKTFVLSEKIRKLLPIMDKHEGVIAISFTNKASKELQDRSLKGDFDKKESFFGTIHKFYISEIILSFGKQIFGLPENKIEILDITQVVLENYEKSYLEYIEKNFDSSDSSHIDYLKLLFTQGTIYLNLIEIFAIYIYDHSFACRNYLKSKYKYVIIDEFQDCGKEQFEVFMKLKDLGLTAIAVGDLDQSIYEFTGKSPEFLSSLINNSDFTTFSLSRNHRCHPSIINYSLSLMSPNVELLETDEIRVYHRNIPGKEVNIANWIDTHIQTMCVNFNVESLSEVAILTRGHRTAKFIDDNMTTPHRILKQSSLESDNNQVSQLFDNILKFSYDTKLTITEVIEMFISLETLSVNEQKNIIGHFRNIKSILNNGEPNFAEVKTLFKKIAEKLIPSQNQENSLELLDYVLNNELEIYSVVSNNQIQIMTLHKSKGLEFDIVFHLDLYEWILPAKGIENRQQYHINFRQDLNLHYVGVTRAKKACILCTSTDRTNGQDEIRNGNPSEFLSLNNLQSLRK
ncbi:UvrD-helicase domain-containing protein [Aliarcobacter butzleri]|uniref:UvrD-helicase domain-containing protein n=1 Tax=Aliarcobacter butzleri TaxID=28197 RepID=UPI003AF72ED7